MFRSSLFWLHLACGLIAGLVVFMMSITGVILTYERQMQVWEDRSYYAEPQPGQQRLNADQLIEASRRLNGFVPTSLTISSDRTAPAVLRQGSAKTQVLNPYSGQTYEPHADSLSAFFVTVRGWHRWFNINGDGRDTARYITAAANLMFLFLLLSGIYLWLPKVFTWATLRVRILLSKQNKNGQARDFNWHHVFGLWAALPLLVIIVTATTFKYRWTVDLLYRLAGEETPVLGAPANDENNQQPILSRAAYADLIAVASTYSDDWLTITLAIPNANANTATLTLDDGDGGQPHKRHVVTLDASSGDLVAWAPFTSQTAGTQARRWIRYLHTGEAFGIPGQTIAGLASFAGIIMVWTGLALALRRFRRWVERLRLARRIERSEAN